MHLPRRRARLTAAGAAVVSLLIAAAAMLLATLVATPANAAGTGTGYLRTNGNKIVDATGATVRITGINWFGMETDNHTFHGLWAGPPATWRAQIDKMASLGFNTLRVPWTGDSIRPGAQATSINTFTNPDLVGLSPLEVLDRVIQHAGSRGMRVILDRHRPTAAGQTALWYTPAVSEASIIADWQTMARRYAGNTTVIGADLFNEPHAENVEPNGTGSCWGCGIAAKDWRLAAERIGNAILSVESRWLIFVEGVSCDGNGGTPNTFDTIPDDPMACDWWGGNLAQALANPVRLSVANRLVYSPHDYGISVFDRQPWFRDPTFPNNLPAVWDHFWGYLHKQNIAPIMLGEFGSTLQNPLDVQWLNALMQYLGTGVNGMSFTFWAWNPNSGDTGGIALDDWISINQAKYNILQPFLIPPVGGGGGPTTGGPTGGPTTGGPTTGGPGTISCSNAYRVVGSWPQGFQGELVVRNTGTTTWNNWTVTWTMPSGVTVQGTGWGGTVTQSGTTWSARGPSEARSLAPNATATIGFVADGPSTPAGSNFRCTSA